jgi:hypothetical protein
MARHVYGNRWRLGVETDTEPYELCLRYVCDTAIVRIDGAAGASRPSTAVGPLLGGGVETTKEYLARWQPRGS